MSQETDTKSMHVKSMAFSILKGTVVSCVAAFVFMILFALVLRFTNLSGNVIAPVNMVIKILSLFIGMKFACKQEGSPLIKGAIIGVCFILVAFLLFSVMDHSFQPQAGLLYDIALGAAVGFIWGAIFRFAKK